MTKSSKDEGFFKKLEDDGLLVHGLTSLGWAFWPYKADGTTTGYFDEDCLRKLADEIERRNKPFWDKYEEYCRTHEKAEDLEGEDENGIRV